MGEVISWFFVTAFAFWGIFKLLKGIVEHDSAKDPKMVEDWWRD